MRYFLFTLLIFSFSQSFANPSGESIIYGKVKVQRSSPRDLVVRQGSERAVIHWKDFSILQNEKTVFVQPNKDSVTLNRVVGSLPSKIDGRLYANGHIILVNPNGVILGETGVIHAASFSKLQKFLPDEIFFNKKKEAFELAKAEETSFADKRDATVVRKANGQVFLEHFTEGTLSEALKDTLVHDALIATLALKNNIPERLWMQEFSILVDEGRFLAEVQARREGKRENSIVAFADSKSYLLRSTMSGDAIRILDRYEEFIQTPYWNTPYLLDKLKRLEEAYR